MVITEDDIDTQPADHDDTMTAEEWWDEFIENACCPDWITAANRLCGCGGSGSVPSTISRLLRQRYEEVF